MIVEVAKRIAYEAHAGQTDKSGMPYVFHPAAVARIVRPLGEDFEVLAWVHDVDEDNPDYGLPLAEDVGPRDGLTPAQAADVDAITRRPGETHFDFIRRCRQRFRPRVVKIADTRHNLSPERLASLEPKQVRGLEKRYDKSLLLLEEDEQVG